MSIVQNGKISIYRAVWIRNIFNLRLSDKQEFGRQLELWIIYKYGKLLICAIFYMVELTME